MNVDMNVDDLLKEIEAKRKSKRLPCAAWKMYAGTVQTRTSIWIVPAWLR